MYNTNGINMTQLFPLTLATGNAFCNRKTERDMLCTYVLSGQHVWLQAHRRYGKSSLIMQVLRDIDSSAERIVSGSVDLLLASSNEDVARKILTVIGNMAGKIPTGTIDAMSKRILAIFKRLKVEVSITSSGPHIKFHEKVSPDAVSEALKSLDKLAKEHKIRCLLYIDEFQNLGEIDKGYVYEAAIRAALQEAKFTTYIFSGSNRRLMEQAFTDKKRPLFRHCRSILLERINTKDYEAHLIKHSRKDWVKPISEKCISLILELTQRHAFYVNSLCSHLWMSAKTPTPKQVTKCWEMVLAEARQSNEPFLLGLSTNQRKLLIALAKTPTTEPTGQTFQRKADISVGSIPKTMEQLLLMDLVYKSPEGIFCVLDPAIAELLRR